MAGISTDVLIIATEPAGLAAAALLASQGVSDMAVNRDAPSPIRRIPADPS